MTITDTLIEKEFGPTFWAAFRKNENGEILRDFLDILHEAKFDMWYEPSNPNVLRVGLREDINVRPSHLVRFNFRLASQRTDWHPSLRVPNQNPRPSDNAWTLATTTDGKPATLSNVKVNLVESIRISVSRAEDLKLDAALRNALLHCPMTISAVVERMINREDSNLPVGLLAKFLAHDRDGRWPLYYAKA